MSNMDVSRVLGKMWKELTDMQQEPYKQKASELQKVFKQEHPDYIYRKARMKRALSEMLLRKATVASSTVIRRMYQQVVSEQHLWTRPPARYQLPLAGTEQLARQTPQHYPISKTSGR
jgi:hypothetical protein